MIVVKVTYKVSPEFVATNKMNIENFLQDLKRLDNSKFRYHVFVLEDGVTFLHLSIYENAAIQNEVLNVRSFLEFQKKRDESGLGNSHKVEKLELIGSTFPVL